MCVCVEQDKGKSRFELNIYCHCVARLVSGLESFCIFIRIKRIVCCWSLCGVLINVIKLLMLSVFVHFYSIVTKRVFGVALFILPTVPGIDP